jgi:hypothetical protein
MRQVPQHITENIGLSHNSPQDIFMHFSLSLSYFENMRERKRSATACLSLPTAYFWAEACTDTYVSSGDACFKCSCPTLATTVKPRLGREGLRYGVGNDLVERVKATPRGGSKEPFTEKDTVLFTMSHDRPSTSPPCHTTPKALLLSSPHLLTRTPSKAQLKALSRVPPGRLPTALQSLRAPTQFWR